MNICIAQREEAAGLEAEWRRQENMKMGSMVSRRKAYLIDGNDAVHIQCHQLNLFAKFNVHKYDESNTNGRRKKLLEPKTQKLYVFFCFMLVFSLVYS